MSFFLVGCSVPLWKGVRMLAYMRDDKLETPQHAPPTPHALHSSAATPPLPQDMEAREIGAALRHPAAGAQVASCVAAFPYLQARSAVAAPASNIAAIARGAACACVLAATASASLQSTPCNPAPPFPTPTRSWRQACTRSPAPCCASSSTSPPPSPGGTGACRAGERLDGHCVR